MTDTSDDDFFGCDAVLLARKLIGCRLYLEQVGGVIVETEAYTADDPASHSFQSRALRNAAMFGPAGVAYVYRSYGLHWCLNIVAGAPGSAVHVRALEPDQGLKEMARRRGTDKPRLLCAGPGRLCQALGVTGAHNRLSVQARPSEWLCQRHILYLSLVGGSAFPEALIECGASEWLIRNI